MDSGCQESAGASGGKVASGLCLVGHEKRTVPRALLALLITVGGDWPRVVLQPQLVPQLISQVVKNMAHPTPPEIRQFMASGVFQLYNVENEGWRAHQCTFWGTLAKLLNKATAGPVCLAPSSAPWVSGGHCLQGVSS